MKVRDRGERFDQAEVHEVPQHDDGHLVVEVGARVGDHDQALRSDRGASQADGIHVDGLAARAGATHGPQVHAAGLAVHFSSIEPTPLALHKRGQKMTHAFGFGHWRPSKLLQVVGPP